MSMDRKSWENPVAVWLGRDGTKRVMISNAAQAARVLDDDWPEEGGDRWRAAVVACIAVKEGENPDIARAAFELAAAEAGILAS